MEAMGVCVDELVLRFLEEKQKAKEGDGKKSKSKSTSFDGSILCRATLYSKRVMEDRGFVEIEDMNTIGADITLTHKSSLESSLSKYAERATSTSSTGMAVGARERALRILVLLGRIEEKTNKGGKKGSNDGDDGDDGDDGGYDPWAGAENVFKL